MKWMERLLRGDKPQPPTSSRSVLAWDELVALARSRDGRQRQAAVRALSASSHGPALPALLERLNDWVDAVRRDARVAVDNFLRDELLDAWIAALPGVAALARGGRADHTDTLARIVDWLVEPRRLARLRAAPGGVPREVQRLLLRAQLRPQTAAPQRLAAWRDAFLSDDIVLASDAAEALRTAVAAGLDDVCTPSLLTSLSMHALTSRFSGIRLAGLRTALALSPEDGLRMARRLCFDRNTNARALAIAALHDDVAAMTALVSQALAGLDATRPARERATALEALCALDDARGLAACRSLRHDPVPAVRVVALRRVLVGADADERDALVGEALTDLSGKVRRVAVAQVHRGANPPSVAVLASLCLARPATLASLLSVASRVPPWHRVVLLMDLVQQFEASTPAAERMRRELGHWCVDMGRCFVTPTSGQGAAVRRAWAAGRDLLPHDLHDKVAFHLRSFGLLAS